MLRGSTSPWHAYLEVLPQRFDTPMFWSAAELAELQASAVAGRVGRADADRLLSEHVVARIRGVVRELTGGGEEEEVGGEETWNDERLLELAHRVGSAIMAYAFDLEAEGDEDQDEDDDWVEDTSAKMSMGMVPMADILNSDAEFNVSFPLSQRWVFH